MRKVTPPRITAVAASLAVIGLAGCGGGGGIASNDVARVGATAITKSEVSHWMATLAGGEFYELSKRRTMPAGLVSEPANYARCVASLERASANAKGVSAGGANKPSQQTAAQLLSKCRQLYQALKAEATAYLVNAQWVKGVATALGVQVSDAEARETLKGINAAQFPKPGDFRRYLTSTNRSLGDELLVVKLDLLAQGVERKLRAGGKSMLSKLAEAGRKREAETDCRAGYVVKHCKQYTHAPAPSPVSPAILMEQVATVAGAHCTNRQACG